jgi:hypothetical protein
MTARYTAISDGTPATPTLFNDLFDAAWKGDVHHIRRYGAAADNATDDAAAIALAVAACPAGGIVELGSTGTVRVGSTIAVAKGVTIRSSGAVIKRLSGTGPTFDVQTHTDTQPTAFVGIIDTSVSGTFVRLASGQSVPNLNVTGCTSTLGSITISGGVTGTLRIERNNVGDGTSSRAITVAPTASPDKVENGFILHNFVYGNAASGSTGLITTGNGSVNNLIVIGNHAKNCAADGFDLDSGSRRAVIMANFAEGCNQGFDIKPATDPRWDAVDPEDVVCVGNSAISCASGFSWRVTGTFTGNVAVSNGAPSAGNGVYVENASGSLIANNYIKAFTNGVSVAAGINEHRITGNVIEDCAIPVRLGGGDKHVVEGNTLIDWTTYGVHLPTGTGSGVIVRNNRIKGTGQFGVRIDATWTGCLVRGNDITGYSQAPVFVNASSSAGESIATTFTNNDATPSVIGGGLDKYFICSHSSATNITNFDDGLDGQAIEVHFTTGNATIVDGTNIMVDGSANYNAPAGTVMTLRKRGAVWYETGRRNT